MSTFTSTILITGGTTGLGYWAAYELARQSPTSKVIISSRVDRQNAVKSLNDLLSKTRSTNTTTQQVEFMSLDLSSTANVRTFVKTLDSKNYPPISSLLLNAGIQFHDGTKLRYSPDGIEMTFATNHLGHALLFFLLKPHLTDDARIVITASGTHDPIQMAKSRLVTPIAAYESAELLAHPTDNEGYSTNDKGIQRYASSKLANVMFVSALERRLSKLRATSNKSWTVVAMDPGLMPGTSLARDAGAVLNFVFVTLGPWIMWFWKWMIRSDNVHLPRESGEALAWHGLAGRQQGIDESGKYFEGRRVAETWVGARDEGKQEDLWGWSVQNLGRDEAERREFERFE